MVRRGVCGRQRNCLVKTLQRALPQRFPVLQLALLKLVGVFAVAFHVFIVGAFRRLGPFEAMEPHLFPDHGLGQAPFAWRQFGNARQVVDIRSPEFVGLLKRGLLVVLADHPPTAVPARDPHQGGSSGRRQIVQPAAAALRKPRCRKRTARPAPSGRAPPENPFSSGASARAASRRLVGAEAFAAIPGTADDRVAQRSFSRTRRAARNFRAIALAGAGPRAAARKRPIASAKKRSVAERSRLACIASASTADNGGGQPPGKQLPFSEGRLSRYRSVRPGAAVIVACVDRVQGGCERTAWRFAADSRQGGQRRRRVGHSCGRQHVRG